MAGKAKPSAEQEAANEIYKVARADADREMAELKAGQAERERLIARYHEAVGQIKTANMFAEFARVSELVWIQQMRDTKAYKEVGTWETFCESIGYTRQHVEDQLKNLSAFGEKFTQTVCALGVGYRDLRKLRQLTHDGTVTIDAEAVTINGETIPLDSDHKEDLQAAIEKIIEEQARMKEEQAAQEKAFKRVQEDTHKSVTKLQKELDRLEKSAKAKELLPEEDAVLSKIADLGVMLNGHCLSVENVYDSLQANPFHSGVAAFISLMDNVIMRCRAFRETAVAELAPAGMADDDWVPPPLRVEQ
jgi:hypothetical protein